MSANPTAVIVAALLEDDNEDEVRDMLTLPRKIQYSIRVFDSDGLWGIFNISDYSPEAAEAACTKKLTKMVAKRQTEIDLATVRYETTLWQPHAQS